MPGLTSPQNYPYPLYTEANNGPAQIQALAEAIDDSIVAAQANIALAVERKRGRASGTVGQSIPSGVLTKLTYNSEDLDNNSMIDLAVDNSIITVVTAGIYLVTGEVSFAANTTSIRLLEIHRNALAPAAKQVAATPTLQTRICADIIVQAAAGDTFSLWAFQLTGGAVNTDVRRITATRLSG
jgi:hypothetical protein